MIEHRSDHEGGTAKGKNVGFSTVSSSSKCLAPDPALRQVAADKEPTTALHNMTQFIRASYDVLSGFHAGVPEVVQFRVSDRPFAVRRDLLLQDPQSLLFVMISAAYLPGGFTAVQEQCCGVRTTCNGASTCAVPQRRQERSHSQAVVASSIPVAEVIIGDRDPTIFGMLMNLLRGYANAIPLEWQGVCKAEADYYGLKKSWEARFKPGEYFQFRNPCGGSKLFSDMVCGLASAYFSSGQHYIDYAIVQGECVAVGLCSSDTDLNARDTLREGGGFALYWNDGSLRANIDALKTIEGCRPYQSSSAIRVRFDADSNVAQWVLNEVYSVCTLRLPRGRTYAFCALTAHASQVNIVSTQ